MGINYSPRINTDGLILYMDAANVKSYPGSGNYWSDMMGSIGDASLVSSPPFSTDGNGSIDIQGTATSGADYVEFTWTDTPTVDADHTIFCWQRLTESITTANGDRITPYKENTSWSPGLWYHSTTIRAHTRGRYVDVTWTYNQNWRLVGQAFDDSANLLKVIIDGSTSTGTPTAYTPAVENGDMRLGNRGTASTVSHMRGKIGMFAVYNRMMSDKEIQDFYEETKWRYQ